MCCAGTSQTIDSHVPSDSSTAAVDLERPARPDNSAQQLQHLQQQVAQTATAAGVLVEHLASDDVESEPAMLSDSWQATVKRLQQLQQDAIPLAERVKASMSEHIVALFNALTRMPSKLQGVLWICSANLAGLVAVLPQSVVSAPTSSRKGTAAGESLCVCARHAVNLNLCRHMLMKMICKDEELQRVCLVTHVL